jgi:hypothetical protein
MTMTSYPTSLVPQLNQVPEDVETGLIGQTTPSHGGLIGGHEFDMCIAQPTHAQPLPPSPSLAPTPRGTTPSSHRPRPVSMPPQLALATGPASASSTSDAKGDRPQVIVGDENAQRRRHRDERDQTTPRPSRTNRILGDYTLSKTLGAGSMGKVKLATHNVTGEKVRRRYWKA